VPALTWARVPSYYLALIHFYGAIERKRSPLEPALRSLVQARISQLNHCDFCIDINSQLAAERAGSLDKALAVADWAASALFSSRERLALVKDNRYHEIRGRVLEFLYQKQLRPAA